MNSNKERKLDQFVSNNVYANVSALIQECLTKEVLNFEDIQNIDEPCTACKECLKENTGECAERIYKEVFQWFIVSDFLLKALEKHDEPILHSAFGSYWGRTCCGQAISMDSVIESIYNEIQ